MSEGIEGEAQQLMLAARADSAPAARQLRARARLQAAIVPIFALFAAGLIAWAWYVRTYVSPGDALSGVYSYAISLMFVAMVPIFVRSLANGWARKTELAVFESRSVAASGDERMPAVIDQPAPLNEVELAAAHTFKPLRWLDKRRHLSGHMVVMLLAVLLFACLIGLYPGWTWAGPLAFLRPILRSLPAIPSYAWLAVYSACYIALFYSWIAGAAGMAVTVDAAGIHWSAGWPRKRSMRIAWNEVRSFTRLEFRHKGRQTRTQRSFWIADVRSCRGDTIRSGARERCQPRRGCWRA